MGAAERHGRLFLWDDAKRRRVLRRHGVDLASVPKVFDGPTLEEFDFDHSDSEDRSRLIGMLDDRCVVVIYTLRAGAIRLVSARRAEAEEESEFEICLKGEYLPDDET